MLITKEILLQHVKANESMPDRNWAPFVADAQRRFVMPYVGARLLEALDTTSGMSQSLREAILPAVQRPLSIFTMLVAADELSINVGDGGHTVTRTDNLAPASDNKIYLYKKNLAERGWTAMEELLELLDKERHALKNLYLDNIAIFLQSAYEFQNDGGVVIDYSAMTYRYLIKYIVMVEQSIILPLLDTDWLGRRSAPPRVNDIMGETLAYYTCRFIAHKSMAMAIESRHGEKTATPWDFTPVLPPYHAAQQYNMTADFMYSKIIQLKNKPAQDTFNSKDKAVFST